MTYTPRAALMLAYLDSYAFGLVPCRVIRARWSRAQGSTTIDVVFTANRGPYRRGEVSRNWSTTAVVPREAVRGLRRRHGFASIVPYNWQGKFGFPDCTAKGVWQVPSEALWP
jgi:hypothetical protein